MILETRKIQLRKAQQHLKEKGIAFEKGLTDQEIEDIESSYRFSFPPDLRWFLQQGLPKDKWFPNWRKQDALLQDFFDKVWEGILFDIEKSHLWHSDWGKKPETREEAVSIAYQHYLNAPKLIPIAGHTYLPSDPCLSDNPVISICQMDAIFRGTLVDYLFWIRHDETEEVEDDYEKRCPVYSEEYRKIPFWTEFVKENVFG
ncbi:Hypothetical protein PBC10988_16390 [Planctomycetales bacterium 10988]|nr:Hypothetical protein PBC10988_16390 [Planctomycetales bacterium 10988]